jgi:S1-C subfamily serine protease
LLAAITDALTLQNWKEVERTYLSLKKYRMATTRNQCNLSPKCRNHWGIEFQDPDAINTKQFKNTIQSGIGATLMPDQQKHIIVGAPPVAGSASDKAGLKVGDYIVAVNGIPTDEDLLLISSIKYQRIQTQRRLQ